MSALRSDPDGAARNHAVVLNLDGPLDAIALAGALQAVCRRHATLRTRYSGAGTSARASVAPDSAAELVISDLAGLHPEDRPAELDWLLQDAAQIPFDVARAPLLRGHLLRLEERQAVLLLLAHACAFDTESETLLVHELFDVYERLVRGGAAPIEALPAQYRDYAAWQRRGSATQRWQEQTRYWQRRFDELPDAPDLPCDRPRAAGTRIAACRAVPLPAAPAATLQALADGEQTTTGAALLSALIAFLHLCTGQRDIVVSVPRSGRPQPGFATVIGNFENRVLVRVKACGGDTFRKLLRRVRDTVAEAHANGDLPWEELDNELRRRHGRGADSFCRVTFDARPAPMILRRGALTIAQRPAEFGVTEYDWTFEASGGPEGLQLALRYDPELCEPATIEHALDQYRALIEAAAGSADGELRNLLRPPARPAARDAARAPFRPADVHQALPQRFREQVRQAPDRIAIRTPDTALSYEALDRRANQLARAILAAVPAERPRVALLSGSGPEAIVALLAALKAGKTYVPLDASYPEQRLAQILADADVGAIVADSGGLGKAGALSQGVAVIEAAAVAADADATDPGIDVAPESAAYIIYTSGSTGRPKGVVQSHRGVLHFIRAYTNCLGLRAGDRLSLIPSYSVDAGVMDVYGGLLNGATLYPYDLKTLDFDALRRRLAGDGITVYHSTPTVYRFLVESLRAGGRLEGVRAVVLGGEPVITADAQACREHFGDTAVFLNLYGSTEASFNLEYLLPPDAPLPARRAFPAGGPVEETEVLLLDEDGEPAPLTGEIGISSPYVALEYWRQPELSAAVFTRGAGGAPVYRTGDVGRYLPDGAIEVMGRRDFQVKIRGFRVEIGEVEAVLAEHEQVAGCVVVLDDEPPDDRQLTAFFIPREPARPPATGELRALLQKRLPDFMIPARFVPVAAFPLTPTRKIDRRRLARLRTMHGPGQ